MENNLIVSGKYPFFLKQQPQLSVEDHNHINIKIKKINPIADFLLKEQQLREEDFNSTLKSSEFLSLPESIQKLIVENKIKCRDLIKNYGLTFFHLRELSETMISTLFNSAHIIYGLTPRNIGIGQIILLGEEKLKFLSTRPGGLYALLDRHVTIDQISMIDQAKLMILLTQSICKLEVLLKSIEFKQLINTEDEKLKLLIDNSTRVIDLMNLNIPFDQITQLPFEELEVVLTRKGSLEPEEIESTLLSSIYQSNRLF